jgi:hypothetical protein
VETKNESKPREHTTPVQVGLCELRLRSFSAPASSAGKKAAAASALRVWKRGLAGGEEGRSLSNASWLEKNIDDEGKTGKQPQPLGRWAFENHTGPHPPAYLYPSLPAANSSRSVDAYIYITCPPQTVGATAHQNVLSYAAHHPTNQTKPPVVVPISNACMS